MTLPFRCEDCGAPITLTPDEMLAIYDARISLCQRCIDSIAEDAEAYRRMHEDEGRACEWDAERGAFVMRTLAPASPSGAAGPERGEG